MADLKLAPGFEEARRARLQTPEGQQAIRHYDFRVEEDLAASSQTERARLDARQLRWTIR